MSTLDYNEQVAALLEDARVPDREVGGPQRDRLVQAARTLATLEVGKQAAVRNLLLVATVPDSLGANPALRREAFQEAARILGLVEEGDVEDLNRIHDEMKEARNGE